MDLTFEYEWNKPYAEESEDLQVEVEFTTATDSNYGADADGNRGVAMTFVEDLDFKVLNDHNEDITSYLKIFQHEVYEDIAKKALDQAQWAE